MTACVALAGSPSSVASYPVGVLADQGIDYEGSTWLVDSFDSGDPLKSTDGRYDPTKAGDAAEIVTKDGITNSLPTGSALIYGHLYTGSNSPVVLGTGGIGTHVWLATNSGIEPGYRSSGVNLPFPDTAPPHSSGLVAGPGDVVMPPGTTNHYDQVLHAGDYYATNLTGSTIVVGAVRLVMPNGLQMAGNDGIIIASGGSLELYAGGTHSVVGGNGIVSQDGLARTFVLYGSPTLTNLTLNLTALSAVIIAPNSATEINGAGRPVDVSGAVMVQSLRLNGNCRFHFDQSLTAAATLHGHWAVGTDQFEVEVVGFPGFRYTLQASIDLHSWTSVATNVSPFTVTDAGAVDSIARFYRAIYSP